MEAKLLKTKSTTMVIDKMHPPSH